MAVGDGVSSGDSVPVDLVERRWVSEDTGTLMVRLMGIMGEMLRASWGRAIGVMCVIAE